jgi:hypothetical protein
MMWSLKVSGAAFAATAFAALISPRLASAQSAAPADGYYAEPTQAQAQEPPIPPYVEGQPVANQAGGYCYVGPHPVDTRVQPGPAFEEAQGQHIHPYPPIDLRLFSFRDGCYYFIGDPRDFGYAGRSYSYYGAHPVLDTYGGGWCFMMGGHYHLWQPWSPYFTVVGPWYYWYGPYDPFFWSYWPYYSFYYRSYYPNYYAGGRFYRGGSYRAAPPIQRVPATAWRGTPAGGAGFRGSPPAMGAAPGGGSWRGTPPTGNSGTPFRATAPGSSAGVGWRGTAPAPSYSAPFRSAPSGGGFSAPRFSPSPGGGGGGAFRGHRR